MNKAIILISLMAILITTTYAQCEVPGDCLPTQVNYTQGTLPTMSGGNLSNLSNTSGLKPTILGLAKETLIKIACLLLILIPILTVRPPHIGILFSILVMDFIVLIIPTWFSVTNSLYASINILGLIVLIRGGK